MHRHAPPFGTHLTPFFAVPAALVAPLLELNFFFFLWAPKNDEGPNPHGLGPSVKSGSATLKVT